LRRDGAYHFVRRPLCEDEFDDDTRRAYASRVRGYLAWLDSADVDGDPRADAKARDGAVRDYRTNLQTVANRKPASGQPPTGR
jgi:hypothetical protein